jgi:hypothetical protein
MMLVQICASRCWGPAGGALKLERFCARNGNRWSGLKIASNVNSDLGGIGRFDDQPLGLLCLIAPWRGSSISCGIRTAWFLLFLKSLACRLGNIVV